MNPLKKHPKTGRSFFAWLSTLLLLLLLLLPQLHAQGLPTVAVADFEVRVRKARAEIGPAMGEILTNALFETGKYRLVDRSNMKQILAEQKRVLDGAIDEATGAQVGKMLGAQYLVIGTLTKFTEKEGGGLLGAISKKAGAGVVRFTSDIGLSLKIVDATTGELMESKNITKKKSSTGLAVGGIFGGLPAGGVLWKSKSMEEALEESIRESVELIDAKLPDAVAGGDVQEEYDCTTLIGLSAPSIMVVIPEVHIHRPIPDPAGETEIIRIFVEADFNLVDQQQIAAIRNQERVINATKDASLAAALGVEFGADIIIIGEAFSELAARQNGMISCRARVEARAIATSTGKILVADGQHASGLDVSENVAAKTALKNAGNQIAHYFMQQLCKKAGESEPEITAIEIFLASTNFKQMLALAKILATVPGLKIIDKKLTGNVGRIFVEYTGASEILAEAIIEAQPEDFPFEITGFGAGKLDVKIQNESANETGK